jgi:hypothetical protein
VTIHLVGGPYDGGALESPESVRAPDLVEISRRRRVERYLRDGSGTLRHVAEPDAASDPFEAWWAESGAEGDAAKHLARRAWEAAMAT